MKKAFAIAITLILGLTVYSQKVTRFVWLDKEDLSALTKRQLVICAYTESDAALNRLKADIEKANTKRKEELQISIDYHNRVNQVLKDQLKQCIKSSWLYNSIETSDIDSMKVMTQLELQKLKKAGSENFAVLDIRNFSKSYSDYYGPRVKLPAITLQGIENYGINTKLIAFPLLHSNLNDFCIQDLKLSITLLAKLVDANIKAPKRVDVSDFIGAQILQNCNLMDSTFAILNSDLIVNSTPSEMTSEYANEIKVLGDSDFIKSYCGSEEQLAFVCLPANLNEDPWGTTTIIFGRMLIETKTCRIVGYSNQTNIESMGEVCFNAKHVKNIVICE